MALDRASERIWAFPIEAKVDALLPDGTHRYWSTHCRHDNHDACSATEMLGLDVLDDGFRPRIARQPAQCKTCGAPCICPCHAPGLNGPMR
jgi:hypothetical protein